MIVLQEKTFDSVADFIQALENNVSISFGAAIICLNRAREEAGLLLPNPIASELDQFVSIVYQIRNAFSHDISEPKWKITNPRYQRQYRFDEAVIDLSTIENQTPFEWRHIGGPDAIFKMYDFHRRNVVPGIIE